MSDESTKIEAMLCAVFGESHPSVEPAVLRAGEDFAFHMTDWLADLRRLVALFDRPEVSLDVAESVVLGFLLHAPAHLNAASRLLLGDSADPVAAEVGVPLMDEAFDQLGWHDSRLLDLRVDRRAPGERDEVVLLVEWTNGRRQELRFTGCYALDARMNFGVLARESILQARVVSTPWLAEHQRQWAAAGGDLGALHGYEIETNSTASVIRICAMHVEAADV